MKKILLLIAIFSLSNCAESQQIANQHSCLGTIGTIEIVSGLREAMNNGITKQLIKLNAMDGFYKNDSIKIFLPEELRKVDAVEEAAPNYVSAVKNKTFTDAKTILVGNNSAATAYLQNSTSTALHAKFNPVIRNSLSKVDTDQVWTNIITRNNSLLMVRKINPDLNYYLTNQAMNGIFKMMAVEEQNIRTTIIARTSPLLLPVFAMQDKK
jgi:hypothetical protein